MVFVMNTKGFKEFMWGDLMIRAYILCGFLVAIKLLQVGGWFL